MELIVENAVEKKEKATEMTNEKASVGKEFTWRPMFTDAIGCLGFEDRCAVMDAVLDYGTYGNIPDYLSDELMAVFVAVKCVIDDQERSRVAVPR